MDEGSAWAELDRFAASAGVALDERGRPGETDLPEEPDTETDVEDYAAIITAIRRDHLRISNDGAATIMWEREPKDAAVFKLDPDLPWHYGKALQSVHSTVQAPTKRNKSGPPPRSNELGKFNGFLEILAAVPKGSLSDLRSKRDQDLIVALGVFLALG